MDEREAVIERVNVLQARLRKLKVEIAAARARERQEPSRTGGQT
jgi:hypothetical protein